MRPAAAAALVWNRLHDGLRNALITDRAIVLHQPAEYRALLEDLYETTPIAWRVEQRLTYSAEQTADGFVHIEFLVRRLVWTVTAYYSMSEN